MYESVLPFFVNWLFARSECFCVDPLDGFDRILLEFCITYLNHIRHLCQVKISDVNWILVSANILRK